MNIDYTGKSIVVTGAGSSIGSASMELFARLGARVLAVDFEPDRLNAAVEAVSAQGGTAVPAAPSLHPWVISVDRSSSACAAQRN